MIAVYFKKRIKGLISIILLLNSSLFCFSQKNISYNNQQWLQYYNQLTLSKKLTLLTDASLRRTDYFDKWSQITLRTGLGYVFMKNINGATGVACFESFNNNKPSKVEFRAYDEINSTQDFRNFSVQHRYRIEARYFRKIQDGSIKSTSNFNFRYRYKIFCKVPLLNISKQFPERKLYLTVGDEIFINAGREIKNNRLDNNRLLIGGLLHLNKHLEFFVTYNYQFGQRIGNFDYENSDVLWIGIIHHMNLKKLNK